MKIQITNNPKNSIEGLQTIVVNNGKVEGLSEIVDNSCTFFIVDCATDSMSYEDGVQLLISSLRKIRLNGELLIRGLCFNKMSSLYQSNELEIDEINKKMSEVKSIQDYRNIIFTLENSGFTITLIEHSGLFYEIRCKRSS